MKKTEKVFILDKRRSMAGLEADTIGVFNAMIQRPSASPKTAPWPSTMIP